MFWDDLVMQGRARLDRELLDAQALAGDLVPAGSVFAFLAEHRTELFPDSFIADLFGSRTGRPSLPADLAGSVLVLKELYDLSDAQTAEALAFDLRWKVACGRSLTQASFDPSTLVYWRKRIAASSRPGRVFDAVAQVIAQTGVLRGRRKRCVDSTVFDDAVATQDTVTQLVAAIRKVARVVPGAGEVIEAVCKLDYSQPGKPPIDWDDLAARDALVPDRAARAQARTPQFKQAYPTRSVIERVICWTATQNGRRVKLRYLGSAKNNAWLHTRCAAINLRTLLHAGLARHDGAWVLA
jgi:hypothetical protein